MSKLDKILTERRKTHGDFVNQSHLSFCLKKIVRDEIGAGVYQGYHAEALDMILHKVSRAVCGDINEVDHWRDIAGYATLVANELEKE